MDARTQQGSAGIASRACPSSEELLAFHLGELSETRILSVGEHLSACTRCEQQARHLEDLTDQVLSDLRRSGAGGNSMTWPRAAFSTLAARSGPAPDIPGYEVLGLLGRGGMSVVWKARHLRLNRLVAVKRLRADGAAELERFQAEAQAVARLSHPNIVQIFEVGEHVGQPYLTLEFLDGGALADHLTGKPQHARASALLVQTLARAVHYAHTRGIVHRDLKPANILLQHKAVTGEAKSLTGAHDERAKTEIGGACDSSDLQFDLNVADSASAYRLTDYQAKISDFGIAKHLHKSGLTRAGDIVGTARYMAPEQAGGKADIGPACDVYSLGVILYELLTGRVPLQGPTDLDTVLLVRTEEPVPPRRLQPGVPRDLETICLKCLAKEPTARYGSAEELALDLERFLAGEPIAARPTPRWERAWKWTKRRPAVAALVVLAALVLGIGFPAATLLWLHAEAAAAAEMQAKDTAEKRLAQVEKGINLLGSIFEDLDPNAEEKEARSLRAILGDRLDQVAAELAESVDDPVVVAKLQERLGRTYLGLGQSAKAEALFKKSLAIRQTQLGADDPQTLDCMHNLAVSYVGLGSLNEARRLYEQIIPLRQAKLGPEHRDTLGSMGNLAFTYHALGRKTDARDLGEQTLRRMRASIGPQHLDTQRIQVNLALTYAALHRHADAVKLYQESLAVRQAKLPAHHPDVLVCMANLATSLHAVGRKEDALQLRLQVVDVRRAKFGPDHRDTLAAMTNLAISYNALGKGDDSQKLLEEALPLMKAKLPTGHPHTLTAMFNLAIRYDEIERHADALKLRQETLALRRVQFDPKHPGILTAMWGVAETLFKLERGAEAVPLIDECLQAAAGNPAVPPRLIPEVMNIRLRCFEKSKDAVGCRATAEMWERLGRKDSASLHRAAVMRAVTAAVLRAADPSAGGAAIDTERAMAWLKQAVAAGFNDVALLKQDSDLNILRDREDFQALLSELETRQNNK